MDLKQPISRTTTIILACLLLLVAVGGYALWRNEVVKHKSELKAANNYKNALMAEMKIYKDSNGAIWAERMSLQVDLNQLRSDTALLNRDKKELLRRIIRTKYEKSIIAAGLIETKVKTKVIYVVKPSAVTDSSVTFTAKSDSINFKATVLNVQAIAHRTPSFRIDSLTLSNKAFVNFKWGSKKEGYPVSFSVTNSNPLFKTVNIESYAIPELSKDALRPTFFKKLGTGIRTHGVSLGIGAIVGFGLGGYLFTR